MFASQLLFIVILPSEIHYEIIVYSAGNLFFQTPVNYHGNWFSTCVLQMKQLNEIDQEINPQMSYVRVASTIFANYV